MRNCRCLGAIALWACLASGAWAGPGGASLGVSAGLLLPLQGDLRVTTGSGLNPVLGLHGDWVPAGGPTLRSVLEFGRFQGQDQGAVGAGLRQDLHTRVSLGLMGEEVLLRPAALGGRLGFGVGLYLVRWQVDSSLQLADQTGAVTPSGSSHWSRQGQGLLAGFRANPHLEYQLRLLFSHYGYENQPARVAALTVLWHF